MEIGPPPSKARGRAAFTLMELILVMSIMVMIISLVVPSLKGFFKGRNLDNEALRFLSLTRYGQSRAINEGVPVELWVNPRDGTYGLEALSGYTETKTKPEQYKVDSTVQIVLPTSTTILTHSNYWSQTTSHFGVVTKIRFQPDGFISDASPQNVYLRQGNNDQIWIAEAPTHLQYDIKPANRR